MCNKTKSKNKYFCKCCLQCFRSENVLIELGENCSIINGIQSVKLKSGSIRFKNFLHLFIEKGTRGGIFYIAKRHSKANNKHMKCYDSSKESKYITYLDANNLLGK